MYTKLNCKITSILWTDDREIWNLFTKNLGILFLVQIKTVGPETQFMLKKKLWEAHVAVRGCLRKLGYHTLQAAEPP